MYRVIAAFFDGENGVKYPPKKGGYSYQPGEAYPKRGFKPPEAHIRYLLGKSNALGRPVIEKVKEAGE